MSTGTPMLQSMDSTSSSARAAGAPAIRSRTAVRRAQAPRGAVARNEEEEKEEDKGKQSALKTGKTSGKSALTKKGQPRKKRRGWGPFQSVLKERSVDFNLTLDVQNLQQDVRNLTTLRDILRTKTMVQRHSPEGSLMHVVKEYFHVFRTGSVLKEVGRKRLMDDQDQRAFMHSVMDEDVDVGNGLSGPDVMTDQMIMYSTFIRFVRLTMRSYDIIVAEDSVVITTKATLRFQILRNTIEMIFPHVMGEEWLVGQLVGREIEPGIGLTFTFNADGKCCKYEVDLDFVGAFASIVKDPESVNLLFGRALIADNCMFGVLENVDDIEEKLPAMHPTYADTLEDERDRLVEEVSELQSRSGMRKDILTDALSQITGHDDPSSITPAHALGAKVEEHEETFLQSVVYDYFRAFAGGLATTGARDTAAFQRDFILKCLVPEADFGIQTSRVYVEKRWRALGECFDLLRFQKTSVEPAVHAKQDDLCVIRSSAEYDLRVTPYTIQRVFPHLLSSPPLQDAIVGKILVVPSQISFWVESDTGRIAHIEERLNFVAAMTEFLPNREELSFVMAHALLTLDGVAGDDSSFAPSLSLQPTVSAAPLLEPEPTKDDKPEKSAIPARTMRIADILG